MVKWALLAVLLFLSTLGIYLYVHLGVYKEVTLKISERSALNLIYKDHLGAYHKINGTIQIVEKWAKDNQLDCSVTFGEYLDDPHAADEDRLRSRGGCVLPSELKIALPQGFKSEVRPAGTYVTGHFEGSPAIGPYKVYPKAFALMETERLRSKGPVIELYRVFTNSIQTEFLFPVTGAEL